MNFRPSFVLFLAVSILSVRAADSSAPREAAPAFVEAVTFNVEADGDKRVITVVSAPGLARVDVPTDRMSFIYDAPTQHYTGLEHSNYTWWEFSWPEVRAAVQNSTRYATRLSDIGPELMAENNDGSALPSTTSATDPNASAAAASGSDDSGYVWHPTAEKKRIADFDCVHWIGETVAGETIDAWCTPGLLAPVEQSLKTLRAVNEPMALVPVRNLMPPLTFVAWDALTRGSVTPVLMTWGADEQKTRVALISVKQREGKLSYFQVPKLYVKTTLVTMDGIGNQRNAGTQRIVTPTPQAHVPTMGLPGQ
jgi:hypothetical protein